VIRQDKKDKTIFYLTISVKPNAREDKIYYDGEYIWIHTSEAPTKGKANSALISQLAKKIGISKSSIGLIKGHTSRTKVFQVKLAKDSKIDLHTVFKTEN
jgi:uncharacterized protein